jgi:L-ascorbate metabolism protein UlaG (beta-lactamase superfamily)
LTATITALGQAGVRLHWPSAVIYIDPYLTNYVADQFGPELARMEPAPMSPDQVSDAAWILITHGHADHADPTTLGPIANASPRCRFLCPLVVRPILLAAGISNERIVTVADTSSVDLAPGVSVRPIPAAHLTVERDTEGFLACVGYLVKAGGVTLYHAGDTIPDREIFAALKHEAIDVALLPVNERNYYRAEAGIIGNMSVREAFAMAKDLSVKTLVPIHWDLFGPNSTPKEEIELLYRLLAPPFRLQFLKAGSPEAL